MRQRLILPQGQSVLIAVSGGQDSLCLAKLLLDLQPHWHWSLAIAHCNHGWRDDSTANADHVAQLAASWQLPFYLRCAEDLSHSEAAARDWRYSVLGELAQSQGYDAVVTGHTASDRAETLLYNLLRGSGSDGLQALQWQRPLTGTVQLVRPLLTVTRAETAQFCHQMSLPIWQDVTNHDRHYRRNRIRLELIPYLQEHFNPQIEESLAQTATILTSEVSYLEAKVEEVYPQIRQDGKLDRLSLAKEHLALQRRIVRRWLLECWGNVASFSQVEKVIHLVQAPNRSQTDPLPGGHIVFVEHPWLKLQPSP